LRNAALRAASLRLPRSVACGSFPRLTPAHSSPPANLRFALWGGLERHKQPGRYAPFCQKNFLKHIDKNKEKHYGKTNWRLYMALMRLGRKFKDLGITGGFTRWYDKNTRENRLGEMREYAKEAKRHLTDNANVLEVAPGPGYFSIELAKMGNYNITGMDISADFIEICKANAERENVNINFLQGNVSSMVFEDNTFDFIFCSAAFKNFKDPVTALCEMYRVLKNSGIALIVDMNHDVSKETLAKEAAKISKNGFERWFMINAFKGLCKGAYTKNELENMIKQTTFKKNEIIEEGIGFYIYLYK
jgi:ubiquinone/menaquinone biosynthesis C-methylase UbiE